MKCFRIKIHQLTSLLLISLGFYGCFSDCPVDCPVECVPITFVLKQGGRNILEQPTSFRIDSMRVEMIPANPEAPPLLGTNNNSFKMVVCQNVEYALHLNDSLVLNIFAKLDTFSIDDCCVYFLANSIRFNGDELCADQEQCGGGTFELN